MANTITHQSQSRALTNAQTGTTVFDKAYVPTLTNTWTNGAAVTYAEGEYNGGTTTHTYYMPVLTDDLVTKYA